MSLLALLGAFGRVTELPKVGRGSIELGGECI